MVDFYHDDLVHVWIATHDSRETSEEVMKAIAFFARSVVECDYIWEYGTLLTGQDVRLDVCVHATSNGLFDPDILHWGGRTLTRIMADE